MLILGFADYATQAKALAEALEVPYRQVLLHRFPDGESKLTLPESLADHVVLCRSLDQPNAKLIELMLCAETARRQGVSRLTLVAPYLCYMRQDHAFHPGEVVSQGIVGAFLARLFDTIITVDPHLHRIRHLDQAIPERRGRAISAARPLATYIHSQWPDPVLIGPDNESEQWVSAIAEPYGWPFLIASKHRSGDRDVAVRLPRAELSGRTVVLIDDVASTAETLARAAEQLQLLGVASIKALVTHALFDQAARTRLADVGVDFIGSSDSVPHFSNVVRLAPLLAAALRDPGD